MCKVVQENGAEGLDGVPGHLDTCAIDTSIYQKDVKVLYAEMANLDIAGAMTSSPTGTHRRT
jgi:hypothetical protein